jgi:hypothetical protein
MQTHEKRLFSRNDVKVVSASLGVCAIVTLGTLTSALHGDVVLAGGGAMQTGATSTEATPASTLVTAAASPQKKATPFWGQPSEP